MSDKKRFSQLSESIDRLRDEFEHEFQARIAAAGERAEEVLTELAKDAQKLSDELEERFGDKDNHVVFRELPPPKPLTMSLTDVLLHRETGKLFSDEPLSDEDLGTVLWACDGINRKNGRRTTPSAFDWREIDIWVLKANGIWRWIPEKHGLLFCTIEDVRKATYPASPQLASAPVHLVFVANAEKTETVFTRLGAKFLREKKQWPEAKLNEAIRRTMILDAGIRVQAVHMAAAAMGLACQARTAFDPETLAEKLHLGPKESVIAVQTLGYKATSLYDTFR